MRRLLIAIAAVAAVVACAKKETPPADTAAAMAPAPAPVAVVALTDADVSGTWKGTSTPMTSDSVVSKWTMVCGAGTCKGTIEGVNAAYVATYTLAADSMTGVSKPYSDRNIKGGKVIDTWVAQISGDNTTGTGVGKLASKPDSVVMRYRYSGTRTH